MRLLIRHQPGSGHSDVTYVYHNAFQGSPRFHTSSCHDLVDISHAPVQATPLFVHKAAYKPGSPWTLTVL